MKSIPSALSLGLLAWLGFVAVITPVSVRGLTLELQRRDPLTGAVTLQTESIDPKRIGVIAVDVCEWGNWGQIS